jgi:hypothetical protein
MSNKLAAITTTCVCLLLVGSAHAADVTPDATPEEEDFFGLSLGAKGAVGGNVWTKPETRPTWALLYDDTAGGWGGGGGLYAELRVLWGHLGLEVDLLFERNRLMNRITFNDVYETDWLVEWTSVRIPLLLEGSLEGDRTRVSLGLGPEFVVGLNAETDLVLNDGPPGSSNADLAEPRGNFHARKQTDTYLCVDLGLAIKVWKLAITIDLRYSHNLTQPSKYLDRLEFVGDEITMIASSSVDLRLLLGIAYELGF